MKKIDFEAHFVTEEWIETLYKNQGYPRFVEDEGKRRLYFTVEACEPFGDPLLDKLRDMGEKRIGLMDADGVDMQVLSLTSPGVEQLDLRLGAELARRSNNALAELVHKHPHRFSGFAALAVKDPDGAALELERSVKELGLRGWKTHSNYGDAYLDEKRYWPILAKAEELEVPIFIHPAAPMIPQLRTYGFALAGAPFGFGVETSMVMMRLILSGALDAFPNLKIILGHLGEGLPFVLQRIDFPYVRPHFKADPDARPELKRKPSDYLKENMFVATSGNYLPAAFECTQKTLGTERIIFGSDFPYEDPRECIAFLEGLQLSEDDWEKIYYRNAAQLGISP